MTPTWVVWSVTPPECPERISCTSMLDAARGWADRLVRRGLMPRDGHEVLAHCESDPNPRQSAYRLRISVVGVPSFRASFRGLAFEGNNGNPLQGAKRG